MLLIGLGEGIAAERKQFVCGDTGCGSGVPEARLSRQFFHALSCNLCDIGKYRRQRCLRSAIDIASRSRRARTVCSETRQSLVI